MARPRFRRTPLPFAAQWPSPGLERGADLATAVRSLWRTTPAANGDLTPKRRMS